MLKNIILKSLLASVSGATLTAAIHYSAHAYVEAEETASTYLQGQISKFEARIRPALRLSPPTPDTSPTLESLIRAQARLHHINPNLLTALISVESNFKSDAERFEPTLNTRSIGLTQVLATHAGKAPCDKIQWTDLYNPHKNIVCGASILANALTHQKNLDLALIEYNGGPNCTKNYRCKKLAENYVTHVKSIIADLSWRE